MRVVTAVVAKDWARGSRRAIEGARRLVGVSSDHILPWGQGQTVRRDARTSEVAPVHVEVVTNEPDSTGALIETHSSRSWVSWTGYLDRESLMRAPIDALRIAELSGIFALVDASDEGVRGYTNIHRMEQLYWAEGKDVLVLSTSARMAHHAAGIGSHEVPVEAALSLANAGFMLSDHTPFPGVFAVPANSAVTLSPRGVIFSPLPPPDIDPDEPLHVHGARVTDALVRACRAAIAGDHSVNAHLTGGKDSRVVAAVLNSMGADVTFATNGYPGDPDVDVGTEVARRLGLQHVIRPPAGVRAGSSHVVVNPLDRARDVVRLAGGQITAWEALGRSQDYQPSTVVLGGHGGELLRAGFAFGTDGLTAERAQKRVQSIGASLAPYMTRTASRVHQRTLSPWMDAVNTDPVGGLSQVYREFRTGRWLAVAWGAYALSGPRRSILADNAVVRAAAACRQEKNATEELIHQVVHDLAPELCEVRFAHGRWRFEKDGVSAVCDRGTWSHREPHSSSKAASFNWRNAYGRDMFEHMRTTIIQSNVRRHFAKQGLSEFFESAWQRERATAPRHLWSVFTAAVVSGPRRFHKLRSGEFTIDLAG